MAAEFLHCHPEWLRLQAKMGHIPGEKPGKSWVFIEEDLVAYIRAQYPAAQMMEQVEKQETSSCHSIKEKIAHTGGSKSRSQANHQCREALGLGTK